MWSPLPSSLRSKAILRSSGGDGPLSVMLERERTAYACGDYLQQSSSRGICTDDQRPKITPDDRAKIVDWCYAIVDACEFDRENVALAMSLVDRLACVGPRDLRERMLGDHKQYQLFAVASLYTAIKVHQRRVASSAEFALVCQGTYSREDIEGAELELLKGLSWRICPPTALQVVHRVLNLVESRAGARASRGALEFLRDEAAYQSECAVRGYALSATRRCSAVAAAAVGNAIDQVPDDDERRALAVALANVLGEYDFDPPSVIEDARERLRHLAEGGDGGGNEEAYGAEDPPEDITEGPVVVVVSDVAHEEMPEWWGNELLSAAPPRTFHASDQPLDNVEDDNESCVTIHC